MSLISASQTSVIYLGESIRIIVSQVTDLTGAAVTTPTSVTLDLRRYDGSHAVGFPTTSGIVNDGGGQWHYDYNISATDIFGQWSALWTIVNGTYTNESAVNFSVNQFNGQIVVTIAPDLPPLVFTMQFQILVADPSSPSAGQVWYNSTSSKWKGFDGTAIRTFTFS